MRFLRLALAWLFFCTPSFAQVGQIPAWPPLTTAAAASYQGPGDVAGVTATYWGSCARAYNASYASSNGNLCDLKDLSTGTVAVCTLKALSSGFVNLTSSACSGSTPAAACAAAAGGACVIAQVYDQTGNGNNATQATLANMPGITFADINGLPTINCARNGSNYVATGNITISQPQVFSIVYIRTAGDTTAMGAFGSAVGAPIVGPAAVANTAGLNAGTAVTASGATDASWNGEQALASGASSAININGTDNTGLSAGTGSGTGTAFRVCRGNTVQMVGRIAEVGMFGTGGSVSRSAIYTNEHGSNGYNGAF